MSSLYRWWYRDSSGALRLTAVRYTPREAAARFQGAQPDWGSLGILETVQTGAHVAATDAYVRAFDALARVLQQG
ncbi:MAG TPA: hypothetical protein VMU47_10525 [Caldimonas sp.]|nr:hypothetical protein [Caldimonas sp.]